MPFHLILLRHGESEWNQENRFGGWADLRLTDHGKQEAMHAGKLLKKLERPPQIVFTSKLTRAIQTANIALEAADRLWIDIIHNWHLNERHYGALQGRNKDEVLKEYGHEKYMEWRRSLDVAPPQIAPDDKWSQVGDPRYADLAEIPLTESLHTMVDRMQPYWEIVLGPELKNRGSVLVIGHGNSLRGLIRIVRGVDNDEIKNIDIKTGIPFVIEVGDDLKPVNPQDWYTLVE